MLYRLVTVAPGAQKTICIARVEVNMILPSGR